MEVERARHINNAQITKLEELWKTNAEATLRDLVKPGVDEEPQHVLLRYADGYHYESVYGPLLQLEADYDKKMKEEQKFQNVFVRWDIGMNQRITAYFKLPNITECGIRLNQGDELIIRYEEDNRNWKGIGNVNKLPDNFGEEIGLTLKFGSSNQAPLDCTRGFAVEFVWKSISFNRMKAALNRLCLDPNAVSSYIFHRLMGHEVEEVSLGPIETPINHAGKDLPDLNMSQVMRTPVHSSLLLIRLRKFHHLIFP